jgi:tetratricopeptide (TPR) repeat protein
VGWLWYLGTLVPVIGLMPLGAQSMSNRYTYLPMIGILLLVVWTVNDLTKRWRRRTVLLTVVAALMLGACVIRTRAEIVYWKNGETLWSRAVAVTQNNFMAHYCLGLIQSRTNPEAAMAEYQKSVDAYPDYVDAQRELGLLQGQSGRLAESVIHFEKAIQLNPQNSWAYHDLGLSLFNLGRAGDAVPPFMKAIEVEPQNAKLKDDLGMLLFSNAHGTEAISNFLATAQSDPVGFGRLLDAMQFDTNHVTLINNLALCFATSPDPGLRNGKNAVRLASRACEMTGYQNTICVETLATAYAEDSRFDEAVATAQLACSLATAAGQPDLLKKNQDLLELFRSHQRYPYK